MLEKKSATITFHKPRNYGAVLQAYALQKSILELGIDNEIIDYECKSKQNLKDFLKYLIFMPLVYMHKKIFKSFRKKYLKVTKKMKKNSLKSKEFNSKYNFFITGSDQVWNYEIIGNDGAYLLDFVSDDKKKLSYAASFGISKIPDEKILWYRNNLKNFSNILVREKTGIKILKNLIDKKAKIVLDPVFLLEKEKWNDLVVKDDKFTKIKNKYILIYMGNKNINQFSKVLSKKYNLPIYNITMNIPLKSENRVGKLEMLLTPEEFISAIKNAKFVVTGSFHAVVFSIIYNREFFVNNIDKNKINRSSRQKDLFELLGINNREIFNHNNDEGFIPINWDNVNQKVKIERNKSLNALKKMLGVKD